MSCTPFQSLEEFLSGNPSIRHSSREIPLWIEGKPPYEISPSYGALSFGGLLLGQSRTSSFTLTNTGFNPLFLKNFSIVGEGFFLGECLPDMVYPGRSVEIPLVFTPTDHGQYVGDLRLDAGPAGVYTVRLTGISIWDHTNSVTNMLNSLWGFLQRSVQPAITVSAPQMSLSSSTLEFDVSIEVGEESDPIILKISNAGNLDLVIDSITVSGDFESVP